MSSSLGSRSSTASTAHLPGDATPSQTPGLDILQPDRAVIAPLHTASPQSQQQPSSSLQSPTAQQSQQQSASHPTQPQPAAQGRNSAPAAATAAVSRHTPFPDVSTTAASADDSEGSQQRYDAGPDGGPAAATAVSKENQLRYDAGPEASVSGSSWVSLEWAQGPNLPSWAARKPSLLWLWVQPGIVTVAACKCHDGIADVTDILLITGSSQSLLEVAQGQSCPPGQPGSPHCCGCGCRQV